MIHFNVELPKRGHLTIDTTRAGLSKGWLDISCHVYSKVRCDIHGVWIIHFLNDISASISFRPNVAKVLRKRSPLPFRYSRIWIFPWNRPDREQNQ